MNEDRITFRLIDGKYYVYDGSQRICTLGGNEVYAETERLAQFITGELNQGKDCTSPLNFLCYHYTYLDVSHDLSRDEVADELIETVKDSITADFYLMFRQNCPIEMMVAVQLEEEIISELCECNLQQLVAYMVMHNRIGSMALPHSMLVGIADALDEEDADYDTLKESFLEDLNGFVSERSNMTVNKDYFSQMIDVFIFYFTMAIKEE